MENKDLIFWGAIGLAGIIGIFLIIKMNKPKPAAATQPAGTTPANTAGGIWDNYNTGGGGSTPSTGSTGAPALDTNKVLKIGSTGQEVKVLQKILNFYRAAEPNGSSDLALNTLVIDGNFGTLTNNMLFTLCGVNQITLSQLHQITRLNWDAATDTIYRDGQSPSPTGSTGSAPAGDGWRFIGGWFNPVNYWGWLYDSL